MHPFTEIKGRWDEPVYLIGGGTSLRNFDFSRLDGLGIKVGMNKAAWLLDCDVLVTLDQHFVRMCRDEIANFAASGKEAILAVPPNDENHKTIPGATYVRRQNNPGLSDNPTALFGMNSGIAGLGVAYLRRAPSIALLGYDMGYGKHGTHWHEGYEWHNPRNHKFMSIAAPKFDRMAVQCKEAGLEVINYIGSPISQITAFPTAALDEL